MSKEYYFTPGVTVTDDGEKVKITIDWFDSFAGQLEMVDGKIDETVDMDPTGDYAVGALIVDTIMGEQGNLPKQVIYDGPRPTLTEVT